MGREFFTTMGRKVGELLNDVKNGRIGLPDLQRPFVWKDKKVRDLLDSMLKGFPIGYVMLWESPYGFENKTQIGNNTKDFISSSDLVIDGQQRLTALLAALKGIPVKDVNYKERTIRISYHPLKREFQVWSQAYEKSPEWISSISDVFAAKDNNTISRFRRTYINSINERRLKDGNIELSEDEELLIEDNINDLLTLMDYTMPTLLIRENASEEDVSEIFVRVNSGGQNLTEKNFIETLLSVYDNDIHKKINDFCRESRIPQEGTSYNHIIEVDPVHIIRTTVGLAFKRAKLKYAYILLRGKDLSTRTITNEMREENFLKFKEALNSVMNLNHWHGFMNIVKNSGYLKNSLIRSYNAVMYSYMIYLIGKLEYKVPSVELNKLMTRWFFMVTICRYYTTDSPETKVEKQLADMRNIATADKFVSFLDDEINNQFTEAFFEHTLVEELKTSSTNSPAWFGFIASQNVLGYQMLFSKTPISSFFIIGSHGKRSAIDIHHIFPKHYLESIGINEDRYRNQIANYTYLDYATNITISDNPPQRYIAEFRNRLSEEDFKLACMQNALPENIEKLEYLDFLTKRRELMARLIHKAYLKLSE